MTAERMQWLGLALIGVGQLIMIGLIVWVLTNWSPR